MKKTIHHIHEHVDRKVLFKLRLFTILFIILIVVTIFETATSNIFWFFPFVGILIGFYIGKFVGDMYKFSWDKEKEKVISQIDALGIVVFIIYILFAIGKYWIFGHFLSGNILGVVVVSITAGCMLGRMHSTRNGIHEALEVTGIIKK